MFGYLTTLGEVAKSAVSVTYDLVESQVRTYTGLSITEEKTRFMEFMKTDAALRSLGADEAGIEALWLTGIPSAATRMRQDYQNSERLIDGLLRELQINIAIFRKLENVCRDELKVGEREEVVRDWSSVDKNIERLDNLLNMTRRKYEADRRAGLLDVTASMVEVVSGLENATYTSSFSIFSFPYAMYKICYHATSAGNFFANSRRFSSNLEEMRNLGREYFEC